MFITDVPTASHLSGAFGVDFSYEIDSVESGVTKVAKGLLSHGVTSFCPTVITSPPSTYHQVLRLWKLLTSVALQVALSGYNVL